jgi:hypothetical protein
MYVFIYIKIYLYISTHLKGTGGKAFPPSTVFECPSVGRSGTQGSPSLYEYKYIFLCIHKTIYTYIYINIYIYKYIYIYIYIYWSIRTPISGKAGTEGSPSLFMYTSINMYAYIYNYIYVYICIYVCIYMYMCTH